MEESDKIEEVNAGDKQVSAEVSQMNEYDQLVNKYLVEAEGQFGEKTDYEFEGITYHNARPEVILSDSYFQTSEKAYILKLNGHAVHDRKDGIFQLAHEVVHLLSPVEQDEGNEVNYLEEGMATWFSKKITDRDTGDANYSNVQIEKNEKYKKAYELYQSLIAIDTESVIKLRKVNPVISQIKPEDFDNADLKVSKELIAALLEKF